jgi:hypothetical protein
MQSSAATIGLAMTNPPSANDPIGMQITCRRMWEDVDSDTLVRAARTITRPVPRLSFRLSHYASNRGADC